MPEWLDKLLGRKPAREEPPQAASGALQVALDQAESMALPAVALSARMAMPVPNEPVSSLGGAPSLPDGMDWPVGSNGKKMVFIAQINYADMPVLSGYPERGLLSVFVEDEDVFGCGFPSRDQSGFRTLFFDDPSGFQRQTPPEGDIYSPFGPRLMKEGAPLTGTLTTGLPTPTCFEVDAVPTDFDIPSQDRFYDSLADRKPGALYYGGYPDFVQYDIRKPRDEPALTKVILQLGFAHADDREWMVCWGDAGEATFLMSAGDLENRRFEQAVFSWDCG